MASKTVSCFASSTDLAGPILLSLLTLLFTSCRFVLPSVPPHPLTPLSAAEITETVTMLRATGKITETRLFQHILLLEPPRRGMMLYRVRNPWHRQALAVLYDWSTRETLRAVVDLSKRRIISWQQLPGTPGPLQQYDFNWIDTLVRADPRWQTALRRRGITDFSRVVTHSEWQDAAGAATQRRAELAAVATGYTPTQVLKGIRVHVDLNRGKIVAVTDDAWPGSASSTNQRAISMDSVKLRPPRTGPMTATAVVPAGDSMLP